MFQTTITCLQQKAFSADLRELYYIDLDEH